MIINSGPLTYVSMDEEELTPSHLMIGRQLLSLPDNLYCQHNPEDDVQVTPACLTKRMKYLNTVMERFWKGWRNDYLPGLQEGHCHRGTIEDSTIAMGDMVIV